MKVSVCMITYNHEKYITQAIDGILSQVVNFDYEIVIGEDCSTDNTREIVIEYAKKYPEKFKLLLPEKNLGITKNFITTYSSCAGDYIALCEGDDYWVDKHKLQKQIDFLDANKDFIICHHKMKIISDDQQENIYFSNPKQKEVSTIKDLLKHNFIYTASCVFRNKALNEIPSWFYGVMPPDWAFFILLSQYGKIKYFDEAWGVYRRHPGGAWSSSFEGRNMTNAINLLYKINEHFNHKFEKIINRSISKFYCKLSKFYSSGDQLLEAKTFMKKSISMSKHDFFDKLLMVTKIYFPRIYNFWLVIKNKFIIFNKI